MSVTSPNSKFTTMRNVGSAETTLVEVTDYKLELHNLFAAMDDVVIVVDRDGTNINIITTNSPDLAYLPEEVVGKSLRDIFPAAQTELFLQCNDLALTTGQIQVCEYSLILDHTERWFHGKCSPLTAERLLWVARDITPQQAALPERELVQAQLADQNLLLAKIIEDEPLVDIFDRVISLIEHRLSGAICSLLLLDSEQRLCYGAAPNLPAAYHQFIDGISIGECVISCGTAAFRQETVIVTDIATDPLWQNYQEIALSHGLHACWSTPIVANNDQVLGTLAVYYSEVRSPQPEELTTLIQMANIAAIALDRHQINTALRESELRWQFALEGAGDGIWDWNLQTNSVFFSRRWKAMLGYVEHEIGNTPAEWELRVHPDDRAECHHLLNKHFAGETASYQTEHRLRCKDGSYKWILTRGQVIERTADDQPLRIVGTHTDINDRKQNETALQNLIAGTAATTGKDFFPALVKYITLGLNLRYSLVSELVGEDLHVLAFAINGQLQPTFSFQSVNTPCERAWQDGMFYCERFVQERFPAHLDLVKMGAQSYLGVALHDHQGNAIGNLCILDQQPIEDLNRIETLLNVFAARAGAELERERALRSLAQLNQQLEDKVAERTAAWQASQAQFRRLMENVPGMIYRYVLHPDGMSEITHTNAHVRQIFEVEPEELLQDINVFKSRIHLEDYPQLIEATSLSAQTLTPFRAEFRIVIPDRGIKWVQVNSLPEQQENGDIFWDGVCLDITERKQAETKITEQMIAIEAAEHKMRQQVEHETILRVITQRIRQSLDIQTIFDTACQEIRELIQADRVGIFKFYPDSGFNDGEFVTESVGVGFPSVVAIRVHDHCFGINYASLYSKGRFYVADDIYRNGLTACHTDILAKFAVQANLVMPLTCGEQLWGLLCIHQCASTRHWEQSEIDFAQQIANQLAIAIQQANLVEQLQIELSQRDQTQKLLSQRNEELARATRLKDEFLANMSHELRTPLNAILGLTEGLQEQVFGSINPAQMKHLQTIERSGNHLLELINDILDVAKIESGEMQLDCHPTDISLLCSSSMAFIKQQALKKRIQLETKLPDNLPELVVDERRMRQVLINLLNNAVKFTPEGGRITLAVSYHQQLMVDPPQLQGITRVNIYPTPADQQFDLDSHKGHIAVRAYVKIAITDTGIGIPAAYINKLFQPFIQIDSALNRQYQGTGLGLALVKRIVEMHGGQVILTSEVGRGSCFSIELPSATKDQSAPEISTSSIPPISQRESSQPAVTPEIQMGALILLAEDNEANISTIVSYLTAKGHRIIVANNGREAIDLTASAHPDLILMDIQMPGMDGLTAIQEIRHNPDFVDVPIIAVTALAMTGDRERCLAAGANNYISKPIKLKQLSTMIQQFLTEERGTSLRIRGI